jgi:3-oxoacyl-[acyl-carrier-protein] synthase II
MRRRVVVTGLGALTPLGLDVDSTWAALMQGRSAIKKISRWDPSEMPTQIAAELPNEFDITVLLDPKEARRMDPYTHYAFWAADSAIKDAGLDGNFDPNRAGVIIGTGIGGIGTFEEQHKVFLERGVRRVSPFFITMMIADIASGMISIHYDLKGPNFSTTSACASAGHAMGCALDNIRYGRADIIITGGAEAPIVPISVAGFCANRAMSTRNDEPHRASRPFDIDRDGFIMGEGGAVLVFEEYEHAKARGAKIYCEVAGFGATGDAFHITAPPDDGEGAHRVMKLSIEDADIDFNEIGYVNAHGTSTPVGDISECVAIKTLFGENGPLVSSTKSSMGHLLGAAAGIEAIVAIKALNENIVPPTLNLENLDPGCEGVNHVLETTEIELSATMSNSFGFGGHNSCLVFRKLS